MIYFVTEYKITFSRIQSAGCIEKWMMLEYRLSQGVKKLHYPCNILDVIKSNVVVSTYTAMKINLRLFSRISEHFFELVYNKYISIHFHNSHEKAN